MRTWRDFKTDTFCSRLVLSHPLTPSPSTQHSLPYFSHKQNLSNAAPTPPPCFPNVCKAKIPENEPKMQQQIQAATCSLQLACASCHFATATCHICKAFSLRTEYLNNFRLRLFSFFLLFAFFIPHSHSQRCLAIINVWWQRGTAQSLLDEPPRPATPSLLAPFVVASSSCYMSNAKTAYSLCILMATNWGTTCPYATSFLPPLSLFLSLSFYCMLRLCLRVINKIPNKGMHCK